MKSQECSDRDRFIGAPTELLDERGRTAARTRSTVWGATVWSTV
jgi:hypothetical protein